MTPTAPPSFAPATRRPRAPGRRPASLAAAGLLAISAGVLPPGCSREPTGPASRPSAATSPADPFAPVVVTIGGRPFKLEVAATDDRRQLGLMYRKSMPADAGMVFVFPREQDLGFWMKNTEIPLDIVYLDANGRVVSVKQMQPHDLDMVRSDGRAKYAIELNQGTAARVGVKPGDRVDLPDRVTNPPELE